MDVQKTITLLAKKHNDTVDVLMNYRNFFVAFLLILAISNATVFLLVSFQADRIDALEQQIAEPAR